LLNNHIHIALASDDNYFEGLLTTAWSIAKKCSCPGRLIIHVLDGGITPSHWAALEQYISAIGAQVKRIPIDQRDRIGNYKAYHGTGRMTYARLLLPDLLPDVTQIIYSDVDVLWLADIAELWDTLDPTSVMHVRRPERPSASRLDPKEIEWMQTEGFDTSSLRRFCAGILVFNLDKFRVEKLHEQMLKMLDKHNGHVPHDDETVLNAYMIGRTDVTNLEPRWHKTSGGLVGTPDPRGLVLHFAADTPWKPLVVHHMLTDAIILWHRWHADIRSISTWASLRVCNSISSLLLGRMLYLLVSRSRLALRMLDLAMIATGRRDGIKCVHDFTNKTDLRTLIPAAATA